MAGQSGTDSVTLVLSTLPATVDAHTLVTVTSNSGPWGILVSAELTWALLSLEALSVVEILTLWTVAAVDAVLVVTVVGLVPTGLWAGGAAGLVDHASWA